jgi:uncharacterized protein (DUF1697 family)
MVTASALDASRVACRALPTYVALLRAVNVGGRRVSMADLRTLFTDLGAEDVVTYVQSGNVVFGSPKKPGPLTNEVEQRIEKAFGIDVTVLLRTQAQLAKVLDANPFPDAEPKGLHVTFLADTPERKLVAGLDPERGAPDEFRVVGREVYLHCPNGYGRSKLTNAYFEKQLAVAATTRNWRTVTTLSELAAR